MGTRTHSRTSHLRGIAVLIGFIAPPLATAQPANNDCANRLVISAASTPFTTVGATTVGPDPVGSGCNSTIRSDVWYEYVPTSSGPVLISLCSGTNYDALMAVYGDGTATCTCPSNNANLIECDDDGCSTPGCACASELTIAVQAGACYLIRVGGFPGASEEGSGTINIPIPTVRYVNAERPDDSGDGLSWATAEKTLQAALAVAISGDEIWIANGTYKPTQKSCTTAADCGGGAPNSCPAGVCVWDQPREQTFQLLSGVAVYGGFAGGETMLSQRDPATNVTTLSCDLAGDDGPALFEDIAENCNHVVVSAGGTIVGCTLSGGHADNPEIRGAAMFLHTADSTISDCIFTRNKADEGGAIYNPETNSSITDCTFTENLAQNGGAIFSEPGTSPRISRCVFDSNSATNLAGAIFNAGNTPIIRDSVFVSNTATAQGGAIYNATGCGAIIRHSIFVANVGVGGGAVFNDGTAPELTLANCSFFGNSTTTFGGGAVNNRFAASATLVNCLFSGNIAANVGGGIIADGASIVTVINSTFSRNVAGTFNFGGGAHNNGATVNLANCIFSGNSDNSGVDESSQISTVGGGTTSVNYSLVTGLTGGLGGTGNIDGDPLFADFNGPNNILGDEDDDLRPQSGSPCIDAGSNSLVPADAADLDNDSNTAEPTPIDLDGIVRFIDDPLKADTGSGTPPIVDMGAFEQTGLLFVDAGATGLNKGNSWVDAYTDLQVALAAATPGTEIWVAAIPNGGAYRPAVPGGSRSATFQLESGVELLGGFFGGESEREMRDPTNNETILSGDLNNDDVGLTNKGENSYHVVTGIGTDASALLDGFTITKGNANGSSPHEFAGGLRLSNGHATIRRCVFEDNAAQSAGGLLASNSNSLIVDCVFDGNRADFGGGASFAGGANKIVNCRFFRNTATFNGGGADSFSAASVHYINCVFGMNSAGWGGGVNLWQTNGAKITNCSFYSNVAATAGGGARNFDTTSMLFENSVFWNNSDAGGMDESAQIHVDTGTPVVNYSIVQGGWTGAGGNNSSSDPLFANPGSDDLRLQSGSPAIDAGDTTALPVDADDMDGDGNTTEYISLDLGGNPRVLNGIDDMGAYEFFEDCDGGGVPDVCDLDCGPADGPCDMPGCGDSTDCNNNNVPDVCEIADATSADCNLNGKPDICDVPSSAGCPGGSCVSGCSIDADQNCGPDECVQPAASGAWEDVDWGLGAGIYPGGPGAPPDLSVTIPSGTDITLGVAVEVASFHVQDGASFDVSGGNLTITGTGSQTAGITASPKLRLNLNGTISVANGYDVTVVGDSVAVNNGGVYHSTSITDSALSAVDIAVYTGGEISLEHSMRMTSSGTVTLDGAGGPIPCLPLAVTDNVAGITAPPKLRLAGNAIAEAASVAMAGAVQVTVDSTQPVLVGGDFDNRGVAPLLFDWTVGKLTLNGALPQTFEVAGIDLGQTSEGFLTDVDTLFNTCQHTNYSMGTVEVASTANVTFFNRFANTAAVGCAEALYVHNLIFQSGATVTVDNCKVYYDTLTDNGVTPALVGCGELLSTIPPTTPDGDPSNVNKNRGLALSIPGPNTAGPGALTALRVALVELQNPVPPNLLQNPPPDFSTYEFASTCSDPSGCVRWIGEPKVFLESQESPGSGNFKAARLQCTPLYHDWSTAGLFYIVGAEITPSSKYDLQQFAQTCAGRESSCTALSAPLRITTARSGDVEAPFNPPSTSDQPNAVDIAQVVAKVKNLTGALPKAIAQLQPNLPELNADVNALDVVAVVDAVKQKAYAFSGPCPCPSTVTCGALACPSGPAPCVTAHGAGAMCVKTCTGGANASDPCVNDSHCPGSTCGAGSCRDRCGRCMP